ncbi:glycosyltransferase family protein [Chachezhania antarctica]|uniref:glycosyltransferase family protein n=1 Tax=Chachezhania antarctica TaxID=2340860 RepID=UPI000EB119E3|nr:glycosyltransferase [Chachezhania antarctica]
MGPVPRAPRVMLYSHDTYGLGHLRRSRALAQAITAADPTASALIVTGSPVAGRFTFSERVDHIRLPGVTKRRDGSYEAQALGMDIDETTSLRAALIRATAENFRPDVLIVDKEPTGFRGEMIDTLDLLKAGGTTHVVLGLRDVLDEPDVLQAEWDRKNALEAVEGYYDEIWVYGAHSVYDPTEGLDLSPRMRARTCWTGYLRRDLTTVDTPPEQPYLLVTAGGGGDGEMLIDQVISAYEAAPDLSPRALIVYGPFLDATTRTKFGERIEMLDGRVQAVGFESQIETLIAGASGIICMGGYNTFCEVLSFDKRAVIVPRTVPRLEQYIRASRAEKLGLIRMLDERRDGLTTGAMIEAIRALPTQKRPSEVMPDRLLDGLDRVTERMADVLGNRASAAQG